MPIFLISIVSIAVGSLIIFLLMNKKSTLETPEKQFYSEADNGKISNLLNMPREKFTELIKKLLNSLGFEIEEITIFDSGETDFLVFDSDPVKGGKFVVHCICFEKNKLIDSTYVLKLLDNVKGESALKGILLTPHFFTVEALNASYGVQLELINGEKLVSLLEKFNLGAESMA